MTDEGDEIWRPDYDGPPPVSPPTPVGPSDRSERTTDPSDPSDRGADVRARPARRRMVLGALAVATLVIAAAAVVVGSTGTSDRSSTFEAGERRYGTFDAPSDPGGSTRPPAESGSPDGDATPEVPFAGADPRRLPDTIDSLWSRTVEASDNDDIWVEVIDDGSALVAVGTDEGMLTGSTVVRLAGPDDGTDRWSVDLPFPLRSVQFVSAVDGVVALIVDGVLTGFDVRTGAETWTFDRVPALTLDGAVPLAGTDLIAIGSVDGTSTLVDATNGEAVGRLAGPTVGTDHLGRWYVRRGGDIVEYELSAGFREPTLVTDGIDEPEVVVIDRRVVVSTPEGLRLASSPGESGGSDESEVSDVELWPTLSGVGGSAGIIPMSGNTFLAIGSGSIIGAELDGSGVAAIWDRSGIATATYPTERGYLVLAASRGGAAQTIIDGRNGRTVAALTMTPGLFDALAVTGNGIVTTRTSADGRRLVGLDLDGVEMWAFTDVDTVSVGDRVVVTTTRLAERAVRLAAFGESPSP